MSRDDPLLDGPAKKAFRRNIKKRERATGIDKILGFVRKMGNRHYSKWSQADLDEVFRLCNAAAPKIRAAYPDLDAEEGWGA